MDDEQARGNCRYDNRRDTITTLLIEVLSPSSEDYDRGGKFTCYRTLPSLEQYVLVAQDSIAVEILTREADNRWLLTVYNQTDQDVPFDAIGCTVLMSEIYAKVDLRHKFSHTRRETAQ